MILLPDVLKQCGCDSYRVSAEFASATLLLAGLVIIYRWFFLHLGSRRVSIGGEMQHPDDGWMQQMANASDVSIILSAPRAWPCLSFPGEHALS
jgi:hypothetical protein